MDGTVVLNGDDELLWGANGEMEYETLYYGIHNTGCDLVAQNIKTYSDSTEFTVKIDGDDYRFFINAPGKHHIYNAMAGILVGMKYNVDKEDIIRGVRDFAPCGMRQTVLKLPSYTVIKDCYNASPSSMKAGLEVLKLTKTEGRRVACLADMLELGDMAEQAHLEVGHMAAECGVTCLITIGPLAQIIAQGAREVGVSATDIHTFENNAQAKDELARILKKGDAILVKGSRGMHLEEIADFIAAL